MNRYYFNLRSGDVAVMDDEGRVLDDIEAVHEAAVEALANAIKSVVVEGLSEQHIAVDVRDDIGPVLEFSGLCLEDPAEAVKLFRRRNPASCRSLNVGCSFVATSRERRPGLCLALELLRRLQSGRCNPLSRRSMPTSRIVSGQDGHGNALTSHC
jgi:hypothetical protein